MCKSLAGKYNYFNIIYILFVNLFLFLLFVLSFCDQLDHYKQISCMICGSLRFSSWIFKISISSSSILRLLRLLIESGVLLCPVSRLGFWCSCCLYFAEYNGISSYTVLMNQGVFAICLRMVAFVPHSWMPQVHIAWRTVSHGYF